MVPKDGVGKGIDLASMKALPKRKGNEHDLEVQVNAGGASMKALPKRKGNKFQNKLRLTQFRASMKALPKRKGNISAKTAVSCWASWASMKALPKRKGNL